MGVLRDREQQGLEGKLVVTNIKFSFAKREGRVGEVVGFGMVVLNNILKVNRVVVIKEKEGYSVKLPQQSVWNRQTGHTEAKALFSFLDESDFVEFKEIVITEFNQLLDRYNDRFVYAGK